MRKMLITGAAGLIGSSAVHYFAQKNWKIIGIENNMRQYFFGPEGSVEKRLDWLKQTHGQAFQSHPIDIRDKESVSSLISSTQPNAIVHCAAQPSHDWAANEPETDFSVNAVGTLNLLEACRQACLESPFVFLSTNKVYGDQPNQLPLVEHETRWEIEESHPFFSGIDESMSIDQSNHSLFGVSKAAADLLVQEYGRKFNMPTSCLRGGCLTGANQSGVELHGFLNYLVKCAVSGKQYQIFGHKGKQVRDNISSYDLVRAIEFFIESPKAGRVYNMGGGRKNNVSMLEAISKVENIIQKKMNILADGPERFGDHIWYISDLTRFQQDYPQWELTESIDHILQNIIENYEGN